MDSIALACRACLRVSLKLSASIDSAGSRKKFVVRIARERERGQRGGKKQAKGLTSRLRPFSCIDGEIGEGGGMVSDILDKVQEHGGDAQLPLLLVCH